MTGSHNHSLKELDMTKLNDGIQSWVKVQLRQGFSPIAIEKVARGEGKDPSSCKNLEELQSVFPYNRYMYVLVLPLSSFSW
jgi:hypothetical protein